MLKELVRAFLLIFAAEMGDKTQIIAMTFATQYKVKDVLTGVTLGVLLNHGIAIILGRFISKVVPMNFIQVLAGIMFVVFGILALKDDEEEDLENNKIFNPIMTVSLAFFIGELGDKTQLTAMTLSTEGTYPFFILMGTTLGMIATSSLGIFVGSRIGNKIPETTVKIVSSIVFVFFGTIKLFNTLPKEYISTINISLYMILLGIVEIILIRNLMRIKSIQGQKSPFKVAAFNLYEHTQALKETLDSICLGEGRCGTCSGSTCLIGFTRFILREARENSNYYANSKVNIDKLIMKDYDKREVVQALSFIISDYVKHNWPEDNNFVTNKIKSALELILFSQVIKKSTDINEYIKEINKINSKLAGDLEKRIYIHLR